jgi:lipopolysaccharide biosynthesis glycosyltransferase
MSSKTIVTACDHNFVWGTYLLLLSLRRHGVKLPVHVVTHNLGEVDCALLKQVGGVTLFKAADEANHRNIVYQKTAAILTADSDLILWIDSDSIVTGDITPLIDATGEGLQIRMRPEKELAYLFKKRYMPGERRGTLPGKVLDIWRKDVGARQTPAINTSCNAHCFAVHRRHLDFIRRWDAQIRRVIPDDAPAGVVNDSSFAYFLLDEAVMSSMLAFSEGPPPVKRYTMEDDPSCSVVHFGGRPKPWQRWLLRNMEYFDEVVGLLEWAEAQGWLLPATPWFLQRKHKRRCLVFALLFEVRRRFRRALHGLWKKTYN